MSGVGLIVMTDVLLNLINNTNIDLKVFLDVNDDELKSKKQKTK